MDDRSIILAVGMRNLALAIRLQAERTAGRDVPVQVLKGWAVSIERWADEIDPPSAEHGGEAIRA